MQFFFNTFTSVEDGDHVFAFEQYLHHNALRALSLWLANIFCEHPIHSIQSFQRLYAMQQLKVPSVLTPQSSTPLTSLITNQLQTYIQRLMK